MWDDSEQFVAANTGCIATSAKTSAATNWTNRFIPVRILFLVRLPVRDPYHVPKRQTLMAPSRPNCPGVSIDADLFASLRSLCVFLRFRPFEDMQSREVSCYFRSGFFRLPTLEYRRSGPRGLRTETH